MVDIHSRKCSIDINHYKIIWDFLELLKGIKKSKIEEEEGICTIHKLLLFIQQLWHTITIYPNLYYIVKFSAQLWKITYEDIHLQETMWKLWGPLVDINPIDQQQGIYTYAYLLFMYFIPEI